MNDASTALLVARFIAYHVQDGLRPAAALRRAQLWLRDATVAQIRKDVTELQNELARVTGGDEIAAQIDLLFADLPRTGKPFQHPYYWGGFAMFGASK